MNICPCCSSTLCRCIQNRKITWFCSRCRQEMPNFNSLEMVRTYKHIFTNRELSLGNIKAYSDER
jgi:hypothetical protein